jgi:drug/metabolite transporter (DMT)-like permease
MSAPESSTPAAGTLSRVTTYLIANGTKVAGVYIILKEQSGEGRNWILVAGAALALGAQTVEAIVIAAIDRFFGGEESKR